MLSIDPNDRPNQGPTLSYIPPASRAIPLSIDVPYHAVHLHNLKEAHRFLRYIMDAQLLPKLRIAELARKYAEGFNRGQYAEILHPIEPDLEAAIPIFGRHRQGFQIEALSDSDRLLLADSFRALDSTPQVYTFTPPPPPQGTPPAPVTPEAHWKAVQPQLKVADNLNPTQREELLAVLRKHATVFSSHPGDLGLVNNCFHHINTGDTKPVRMPPYRLSFAEKAEIDNQVGPMEDWGVVRPSSSPFAAAVVLARKKNGKWRFCVDFRGLNRLTVQDNYPLPRIDAIFDQLGKSRYFSMLDAQSGYWQIPMAPEDIHKTAFITHRGLREFVRMPFGLTGAPATYQRMMDVTLQEELHGPTPVATQYLDDTCVHTIEWADHLKALDSILTKIAAINLKLCPTKCLFGANEAEHLGHIVRENQLLPDPEKVRAISEWITPINVSEVRSFLGMVGYYRHFIEGFSRVAKPLHHLTKLDTVFEWGPEQTTAFEILKAALCSSPILIRPDPALPFIVDTDYSTDGIGATISQRGADGQEHPIAFASRSLHGAEVNYSTTDGELLAMVWAITVKFRPYLYGGPTFTCRVDHNPLVYLHSQRNLTGRLARWHMKLMEYNFLVVHRAGLVHSNVDPLSRHPIHDPPADNWDDLPAAASFPIHDLPPEESPTVFTLEQPPICPEPEPEPTPDQADCTEAPAFAWDADIPSPTATENPFFGEKQRAQSPTVNFCEPSTDRHCVWGISPAHPPTDAPPTPRTAPLPRARDVSDLPGDSLVLRVPQHQAAIPSPLPDLQGDRYLQGDRVSPPPSPPTVIREVGWPSDRPSMLFSEWVEQNARELLTEPDAADLPRAPRSPPDTNGDQLATTTAVLPSERETNAAEPMAEPPHAAPTTAMESPLTLVEVPDLQPRLNIELLAKTEGQLPTKEAQAVAEPSSNDPPLTGGSPGGHREPTAGLNTNRVRRALPTVTTRKVSSGNRLNHRTGPLPKSERSGNNQRQVLQAPPPPRAAPPNQTWP